MTSEFGSVITAMVTPFDKQGGVDYNEASQLARYLLENGTDTVLLAGTTGESPTLTHKEEYQLFKTIREALNGKARIMAGAGSNSTATAIQSTKEAEELGMDAVLQVVPYYNKPTQEGLYQHFKAVAEHTRLPVLLYNIPGRTSRNLEPETVARLAEIPNIIGIKEASGNLEQMEKIRGLTPSHFMIYSGDDAFTLPFIERGARGVVSVASQCAGKKIKEMITCFNKGQKERAYALNNELASLFKVLFITTNPIPVKAALNMMGFHVGIPRLPLLEATDEEKAQIQSVLEQCGIIEKKV